MTTGSILIPALEAAQQERDANAHAFEEAARFTEADWADLLRRHAASAGPASAGPASAAPASAAPAAGPAGPSGSRRRGITLVLLAPDQVFDQAMQMRSAVQALARDAATHYGTPLAPMRRVRALVETAPLGDLGPLSHHQALDPTLVEILLDRAWTAWRDLLDGYLAGTIRDTNIRRSALVDQHGRNLAEVANRVLHQATRHTLPPEHLTALTDWACSPRHDQPPAHTRFGFYARSLRETLATNPATPDSALTTLAAFSRVLRDAVITNPGCPTSLLDHEAHHGNQHSQWAAVRHPRADLTTLLHVLRTTRDLTKDDITGLLDGWAHHEDTDLFPQADADDQPLPTRREVHLARLLVDDARPDDFARITRYTHLIAALTDPAALTALTGHPDPKVRRRAVQNARTSPETLASALTDRDALVRRNAAATFTTLLHNA